MANASGFVSPSVPSLRRRFQPSIGFYRSGFCFPGKISKGVFCSSTIEGAEKLSPSQPRVPRGVRAISSSIDGSCIYASGADGLISKIEPSTGNLLGKFRASTKAISSMSVSSDGKVLATAAAQLKIFNSLDYKKIQKFSGHPGAVRCMIFTDDGKYILSSATGERYVAVWRIDGGKKQSAIYVLAMEHPAVFLDSRCIDNGDTDKSGLYVLAISEIGVCYFWSAKNVEDLRNTKPTKVSVFLEVNFSKNHKGSLPTIFAAKLQGVVKPASSDVFVAYGSVVKPTFQKVIVHSGTDIKINISQDGILLPMDHSHKPKKGPGLKDGVTALDCANAEEALLPIPKILDFHDKSERYQSSNIDPKEIMADDLMNIRSRSKAVESKGSLEKGLSTSSGGVRRHLVRPLPVDLSGYGIDCSGDKYLESCNLEG